jgi:membrane fusion protein (multidrug efflux system)
LKPGSTATANISVGDVTDAVIIPATAILASEEGGQRVLIAGSDGLAHESKVEVGVRNSTDAQIVSGVKPGDKVVVEGGLGLDDKAHIKIAAAGAEDKD